MARYPHIQTRVQHEIAQVLGDRPPRFSDRSALPFTNSVLNEVLRFGSVVPIFAYDLHEPVEYDGYELPERTVVFVNMHDVLYDARVWPAPDRFDPDANFPLETTRKAAAAAATGAGTDTQQASALEIVDAASSRVEYLTPFGSGRRVCPGESLARQELFLFAVGILQRFSVREHREHALPPEHQSSGQLARGPLPFCVALIKRS